MRVREAAPADVKSLLPLVEAYWRFEGIDGFDDIRVASGLTRLLATPLLGTGWVAVHDQDVVGYVLAVYVFSLEHGGLTAEIDELYVVPPHRGTDLGSTLLRVAEERCKAWGCTNVSLQLGKENGAARVFYRRNGYRSRDGFELLEKPLL